MNTRKLDALRNLAERPGTAEIIKNHVCEAPTFCFAVVCGKKAAYEDGGKWYCKLHYEHVQRCLEKNATLNAQQP